MKKSLIGIMFVASVSLLASEGADIFKKCASCHGKNAEQSALGASKIIAGWSEDKIVAALKGFENGSYGGSMKGVMRGQASKLTDKQKKSVAKYISRLK